MDPTEGPYPVRTVADTARTCEGWAVRCEKCARTMLFLGVPSELLPWSGDPGLGRGGQGCMLAFLRGLPAKAWGLGFTAQCYKK